MKKIHFLAIILGSAALVMLLLNATALSDKGKLMAFVSSSLLSPATGLTDNVISASVVPDQWTKMVEVEVKSEPTDPAAEVSELKLRVKASKAGGYSTGFSFEKNGQVLKQGKVDFELSEDFETFPVDLSTLELPTLATGETWQVKLYFRGPANETVFVDTQESGFVLVLEE